MPSFYSVFNTIGDTIEPVPEPSKILAILSVVIMLRSWVIVLLRRKLLVKNLLRS